jgi:hypothetical protein
MNVNEFARSIETGWKGKIVKIYPDNMAKMIGVDSLAQAIGGLTDEQALSHDDVQYFSLDDIKPM